MLDVAVVRVPVALGRLVGAAEAGVVGHDHAVPAVDQRPDHLPVEVRPGRLAVEADDRVARALVEVVQPQPVDLGVVRLEVEPGQALEALVGCAEDVHGGGSLSARLGLARCVEAAAGSWAPGRAQGLRSRARRACPRPLSENARRSAAICSRTHADISGSSRLFTVVAHFPRKPDATGTGGRFISQSRSSRSRSWNHTLKRGSRKASGEWEHSVSASRLSAMQGAAKKSDLGNPPKSAKETSAPSSSAFRSGGHHPSIICTSSFNDHHVLPLGGADARIHRRGVPLRRRAILDQHDLVLGLGVAPKGVDALPHTVR